MLALKAGQAAPLREVPLFTLDGFLEEIRQAVRGGARISSFSGLPMLDGTHLLAVLARDKEGELAVARAVTQGSYPALTPQCPQAHLFERELYELWGILPKGHPWLKPVRFLAPPGGGPRPGPGATEFFSVRGEDVHEVAVGPIHAGVIEPGHFRFQCHGEDVFHLEISLGYQHRGVEAQLAGGPDKRTPHYLETAAGDTTVGHATAYAQALEALAGVRVPARAQELRAVALELERLANHTGDLGAMSGDVGYQPVKSFCGRLRGDFLNLIALLCGNRFGRSLVKPGGVGFDLDRGRLDALRSGLETAYRDTAGAAELLFDCTSVRARFEHTGELPAAWAKDLGLVGPAARASGIALDTRVDHPRGAYEAHRPTVAVADEGDVQARAMVRWLEIQESARLIREMLDGLPESEIAAPMPELAPESLAVSLVEGWRGEICHICHTDASGRIASYKIVDPSFHNWAGLAMALRGQQISDFPLCNKSFNLSYCGHDL